MLRVSVTSPFSGESVRVGRTEVHSNMCPRGMVVYRIGFDHCGDKTRLTGQLVMLSFR